jgi:hypothetical protein
MPPAPSHAHDALGAHLADQVRDRPKSYGWLIAPAAISLLLLAGALLSEAPLQRLDSATAVGSEVRLILQPSYLALGPICRVLDTLTLLTLLQLGSLCGTLTGAYVAYGALTRHGQSTSPRWRQATVRAMTATAIILAICVVNVLVPRPMAALAVQSPDVVLIDFHSHTKASHDGRPGFGPEDNRDWHKAAGFNVAYVSDHANWKSIAAAEQHNPAVAGDGTMLLSAVEARVDGYYVIALGPETQYRPALAGNWLNDDALHASGSQISLVYALPIPRKDIRGSRVPPLRDVSALEICDAGPKSLPQSREDHDKLLTWADELNVPVVAASDNHGWGRTAICWTLMKIPGWRQMDQTRLSVAIDQKLREGRKASSVVALRSPLGELNGWRTLAAAPLLVMYLTRSLSAAERGSWITYVWVWALMRRNWRPRRSFAVSDPV